MPRATYRYDMETSDQLIGGQKEEDKTCWVSEEEISVHYDLLNFVFFFWKRVF